MPNRPKIVARELAQKLRLEKQFRREVASLFSRMVKDFRVTIAGTGNIPDANKFIGDWEATLKKHYERVQKAFAGEVLNQQKKCNVAWNERKQDEDDEESDASRAILFALALQQWKEENAGSSSRFITQTNQKEFREALNQAREIVVEQNLPRDSRTLAATAAAILSRKFQGRSPGIVMLNTQQPAESTKLIEANVLSDLPPFPRGRFGTGDTRATKTWWTVGDDIVRDIHKAVHGQKKKSTSLFRSAGNYSCTLGIRLWGQLQAMLWAVGARHNMNYREIQSHGH